MSVIHHNNITDLSNRSGTSKEARNADVQGQTLTGEVSREACSSGDATNSRRLRRVAPAEHRDAGLPVRRARAARRLGTLQSDRGRPFRAGENTRASSSPAGFLRGSLEGGPERGGGQPAATPASRHSASEAPRAPRLHQGHRTAPTTTAVLSVLI